MLADPHRIIAVRATCTWGRRVRFLDWRDGQMRSGKVVAMQDTQVTLHERATRREWKLPYAAIEPPATDGAAGTAQPPRRRRQASRNDFRCGEKVAFEDRYLKTQVGTIVRINQRTATIDTGDGTSWRVASPCCVTSSTSDRHRLSSRGP